MNGMKEICRICAFAGALACASLFAAEREIFYDEAYLNTDYREIATLKSGESFASFAYGIVSGGYVNLKDKSVSPQNVKTNEEGVISAQFTWVDGTAYSDLKCVKVSLMTAGSKLYAKVDFTKSSNPSNGVGYDFDLGGSGAYVATSDTAGGYGMKALGVKVFSNGSSEPESRYEVTFAYSNFLTKAWTVVATNSAPGARLESFGTGITGGSFMASGLEYIPCNQKHEGLYDSVQYQIYEGVPAALKCVKVSVWIDGDTVKARADYAKSWNTSTVGFDFDAGGSNADLATSDGVRAYGIQVVTFTLSYPLPRRLMLSIH